MTGSLRNLFVACALTAAASGCGKKHADNQPHDPAAGDNPSDVQPVVPPTTQNELPPGVPEPSEQLDEPSPPENDGEVVEKDDVVHD